MSILRRLKGKPRAAHPHRRFLGIETLEHRTLLAADVFEPNDSVEAAFDMGQGDQYYSGLTIHESGDDDWYGWTASQTGSLAVAVLFDNALGDIDLELYDASQTRRALSDSVSNDERLSYFVAAGQQYFIHVFGFRGGTHPSYSLEIDGPGSAGASNRPTLPADQGVSTGPSASTSSSSQPNTVVNVPSSGSGSVNDGSPVVNQFGGGVQGILGQPTSNLWQDYDFDGSTGLAGAYSASSEDVFEPNDSIETAVHLGTSDQFLSGLTIHDAGDTDWYTWTAADSGTLSVSILFDNDSGDLDLLLHDSSLSRIALSDSVTDDEQVVLDTIAGQTYAIRVYRFSGSSPVNYRLSINASGLAPDPDRFIEASGVVPPEGQNQSSSSQGTGGSSTPENSSPESSVSNNEQVGSGSSTNGNQAPSAGRVDDNSIREIVDQSNNSVENVSGGSIQQVANQSSGSANPVTPQLPRSYVNTTYAAPQGGTTWTVNAGDNLQSVLNAAQPGDIVELEAGATFVGKFVLPKKTGNEWIYIRSSRHAELPPEGSRIDPLAHGHLLPKLVALSTERWVVRAELGAHHYRLVGIEITKQTGNSFTNQLVVLGEDQHGNRANSVAELPHDIVFDRTYVHGTPSDATREGIRVDGVNIAVVDSYVSDIHEVGNGDTQAILGFNGAGPLKIVNNYLEAAGENILFGGADPLINVANGGISLSHPAVNCVDDPRGAPTQICGLVPSDIEIKGNHVFKPLSWYANHATFAGIEWGVKNLFELKNAQRIVVQGNVFENNWAQAQNGFAFQLTPRNSNSSAPWSTIKDLTIINNIIKNSGSGINILPTDSVPNRFSDSIARLLIRNNLIVNINRTLFGGSGRLFELATSGAPGFTPANSITIDHNTVLHEGPGSSYLVLGDSTPVAENFTFTNNLTTNGQYGLAGSPGQHLINYLIQNNASLPNDNVNAADFVDYAGGDYQLADTSPYRNAGSDGRDIGADVNAVQAATRRSISG